MEKVSRMEVFSWSMGFVGTGIGAGILFLPIQAGIGGIICFFISAFVAFSVSYVSHKVYCKLIIDSNTPQDFPQIVQSYLGNIFSLIATVLFLLLMLGYLSVYIIGFNVGLSSYFKDLHLISAPIHNTWWFPLIILICLISIVSLNEKVVAKIMGLITFPLIVLLLILSIYMIQFWDLKLITHIPNTKIFITGFFNNIPILIFAALFFPPISAMVLTYRKELQNKEKTENYSYKTLRYGQIILLAFTIFFTVSCLFATPEKELTAALKTNLNIMAILSSVHHSKILVIAAPLIAIIALLTSFLGYYFGAKESAKNLILFIIGKKYKDKKHEDILAIANSKKKVFSVNILIGIYLYFIAIMNFNVGEFLSLICVPIIALLLYIIPFIIFTFSKKYKYYRGTTYYIIIIGGILLLIASPIAMLLRRLLT